MWLELAGVIVVAGLFVARLVVTLPHRHRSETATHARQDQ